MAYQKHSFPADNGTASYVAVAPRFQVASVVEAVHRFVGTAMRKYAFHKTVAELSELDNHILKDIGVDRGNIPWVAQQAVKNVGKN